MARAERQTDLLGHREAHLLAEGGMTTPITQELGDGVVNLSAVFVGRHVVRLGRKKKVLGVVWCETGRWRLEHLKERFH